MQRIRASLGTLALCLIGGCGGAGSAPSAGDAGLGIPNDPAPAATLAGTVRDRTGGALAGVVISAYHANDHTTAVTTTDAQGHYVLTGLASGANSEYQVYVAGSGYGFYPSATSAGGSIGKTDFNGLYRGVAEFATLPGGASATADFTGLRSGERMASLARTGQTTSYADGDDASRGAGVAWPATRYTDHADGTVTDQLTGLVWLKNAGCAPPSDWATALAAARQLADGACGLTDGSTAGQWRMPNINELESLVDVSRTGPALSAGHPFTGIELQHAYWSSTTYTANPGNAMAIRLSDGRWINGIDAADGSTSNVKATATNTLWAVRGTGGGTVALLATGVYAGTGGGSYGAGDDASLGLGVPLTSPRWIDAGDGTLVDTVTGLTWLKQADCLQADWAGAVAAVGGLADGQCGLADGSAAGRWRLPNRTEMLSLSDRAPTFPQAAYLDGQYQASGAITGPVIFDRFVVSAYYWTSTTDAADVAQAWSVYSCDFGVYNLPKTDVRYALAVR